MDITPNAKKAMTKDEVVLLIDLIQLYPILTSKETNAATNKIKEDTWATVTSTFNSKCGQYPRRKEQLKLKWDNLKKAARKRAQQIRLNRIKTGGGKPDFIPPDEVLEKVSGLMGSTCTGFEVPYGGDGVGEPELVFIYKTLESCAESQDLITQFFGVTALQSNTGCISQYMNGKQFILKSPGECGYNVIKLEIYPFAKINNLDKKHWWKHAEETLSFNKQENICPN